MFDYHEPDDASSDDGMKNNKRLQQPEGPAFQKFDFDKINEILNGGGNPNIEYRNPKGEYHNSSSPFTIDVPKKKKGQSKMTTLLHC